MNNLLAQTSHTGGSIFAGFNIVSFFGSDPYQTFNNIISISIAIMTVVAGVWFLFLLITGAISLMGSGGDKGAVEDARKRLTTGFIGLLVVVGAIFIAELLAIVLDLDILNPGAILKTLTP